MKRKAPTIEFQSCVACLNVPTAVTPGHIIKLRDAAFTPVATLHEGFSAESKARQLAYARLFAAAPDLLEACLQAASALPTTHGAFETVRAAIAKAYGE